MGAPKLFDYCSHIQQDNATANNSVPVFPKTLRHAAFQNSTIMSTSRGYQVRSLHSSCYLEALLRWVKVV
jgi:hypothetical protein